jgi:hypothetical protein
MCGCGCGHEVGPDYSDEEMHAALDVNIPSYASSIVATDEIVESLAQKTTGPNI